MKDQQILVRLEDREQIQWVLDGYGYGYGAGKPIGGPVNSQQPAT